MNEEIEYCSYCHKRCYSKDYACMVLRVAKSKNNRSSVIPKRAYYCNQCGYWHLTSSVNEKHREKKRIKTLNDVIEDFDLSEVLN